MANRHEDSSAKKHGKWSSKHQKKGLVLYLYWPLTVTLLRVCKDYALVMIMLISFIII